MHYDKLNKPLATKRNRLTVMWWHPETFWIGV
jgi:hypothetical protein